MAEYQLYCFAQSGNAYKPALMLQLAGADWEPRFVDFFKGATREADYLSHVNEMGEVPVLVHEGRKLSQSGVILDYLTGRLGRFGPKSEEERLEILRWTLWDNHKLTSYIATARFLSNFLPEEKRNRDVIDFFMARARGALKVLQSRLEERDWIATDAMTTADLSCAGYIYFLDEIGIDAEADFPAIAAWRTRIVELPGWVHPYDLMPGHPLS